MWQRLTFRLHIHIQRALYIFLVSFSYIQQWTTAHPGNRFNFNSSLILQTELITEVPKVISIDSETRYWKTSKGKSVLKSEMKNGRLKKKRRQVMIAIFRVWGIWLTTMNNVQLRLVSNIILGLSLIPLHQSRLNSWNLRRGGQSGEFALQSIPAFELLIPGTPLFPLHSPSSNSIKQNYLTSSFRLNSLSDIRCGQKKQSWFP